MAIQMSVFQPCLMVIMQIISVLWSHLFQAVRGPCSQFQPFPVASPDRVSPQLVQSPTSPSLFPAIWYCARSPFHSRGLRCWAVWVAGRGGDESIIVKTASSCLGSAAIEQGKHWQWNDMSRTSNCGSRPTKSCTRGRFLLATHGEGVELPASEMKHQALH